MDYELALIGGGNMAEAIVRAAVDQHVLDPERVIVADPAEDRRALFGEIGVNTTDRNEEAVGGALQVMLAVKPQMLDAVAADLAALDAERQIVLSIMAGVSTKRIAQVIGEAVGETVGGRVGGRVVRIMPNTPLLVGQGMSAIALGEGARDGDELLALQIFQAAGEAVVLEEKHMDAVTAVSGSGPAYVFYLAETMADAARELGLRDKLADLLTRQTILGAAQLLRESGETPADLRKKVTSPGGTTHTAVEHMEAHEVRERITEAVQRAAQRSAELGQ